MNAYNYLDEAIRGAIQFVFGFFYSTFILYTRPLTGAKRLYLRMKSPRIEQISSPTYLALGILFATPFLLSIAGWLDPPVSSFYAGLAKEITAGELKGFGPLVGGTIAGTIILSGTLRLVAWLVGLEGRRKDRLVAAGEYQFGLLILGFAAAFSALQLFDSFHLNVPLSASMSQPIAQAAREWGQGQLLGWFLLLVLVAPSMMAAISLWSAATRNPRSMIRAHLWLRMTKLGLKVWKPGARAARAEAKQRNEELYRRFLGLAPGERLTWWRRLSVAFGVTAAAYAGMFVSILLASAAVGGGAYATNWLLRRDPAPDIELLALECRVEAGRLVASAVAWNRSDEPKVRWRAEERLIDFSVDVSGTEWIAQGTWMPVVPEPAGTDLLLAGQAAEISGPVEAHPSLPALLAKHPKHGCKLAPGNGSAAPDGRVR